MPPTSQLTHTKIFSFVISYIRALNRPAHAPVEGKALIRACQDEFCDQYKQTGEEYAEDRRCLVEGIKGLKVAGVLRAYNLGGGMGTGFGLVERADGNGDGRREEGMEDAQRPRVILGDPATSDVVEDYADETQDQDYNPPETQEEEEEDDETPRVVRGDSRGQSRHLDDEEEDEEEQEGEEEEAPIGRVVWSEISSIGQLRSSQQESIDRAEAIRNQEAYTAMTANAMPLIPPPSEQPTILTPTRKRTRTFELAASDDSSSFDPISPHRHSNSSPRRSAKRVRSGTQTPGSGSRRRSAPTRLWSPRKEGDSGMGFLETLKLSQSSGEGRVVKEEKPRDTTAPWILGVIDAFRLKYPESNFEPSNGSINCLDCDRVFHMAVKNQSFSGFDTHLRSKGHKANVTARLRNPKQQYSIQGSLLTSATTDFGMDFNIPQQPLAVFANKGNSNSSASAAALGAQFLAAMESENQGKTFKVAQLEVGHRNAQQRTNERFDKLDSSIEASNDKIQSLSDEIIEKVEASEDRLKDEIQDVKNQLDSTKSETDNQLQSMDSRITKTAENCEAKLDKLFTSMAKSDHRNIENIDDLKVQLRRSDEAAEEEFRDLRGQVADLEGVNCVNASQRDELEISVRELESSDVENRKWHGRMQGVLEVVQEDLRHANQHREGIEIEVREQQTKYEETRKVNERLEKRVEELEGAGMRRGVVLRDLEGSLQMCTEDIQGLRDENLAFQKTVKERTEKRFEDMQRAVDAAEEKARSCEERAKICEQAGRKSENDALERERKLEERLMGIFERRLDSVEKKHAEEKKASGKKTQFLERRLKYLEEEVEVLQDSMPKIFEDIDLSLQGVEDLKERVDGLEGLKGKVEVLEGLAVGMGASLDSVGAAARIERAGSEGRSEVAV